VSIELEQAIRRFRRQPGEPLDARVSAASFRASVQQRLRALERDVGDVKTRINGLIFVVVGAVVTQLVLRVFG
jgi:hypothetical protein